MYLNLKVEYLLIYLQPKQALKTAIDSQDVEGQVKAQEQIATLTMDAEKDV